MQPCQKAAADTLMEASDLGCMGMAPGWRGQGAPCRGALKSRMSDWILEEDEGNRLVGAVGLEPTT